MRAAVPLRRIADDHDRLLSLFMLTALVAGGALYLSGHPGGGDAVLAVSVAILLVSLLFHASYALIVEHRLGVDLIALVAMAGALALGQYLAGAVIALMFAGGQALEEAASRRARRELTALVKRAPTIAHRRRGERIEEVQVAGLEVGDIVVVRTGDLVPVDGVVETGEAVLDESALTGESLPVTRRAGERVMSGAGNAGAPFELRAARAAADSAYAALVRLVESAERSRAPFVRMADRYAGVFLPLTLLIAAGAWVLSGDPVRGLAVVVVATPCPLILAAPIALISGVSRAARRGIIVKGGAPIERLGRARTVLFDKTGTLTVGMPSVHDIVAVDGTGPSELLRLAASVDQLSPHVLAEALVAAAQERGLPLSNPGDVREDPGRGIEGVIGGRRIAVGSRGWLRSLGYSADELDATAVRDVTDAGWARVHVGADGRLLGTIVMGDGLRPDATALVGALRSHGIRHIAMVSGDRRSVAERIGARLGVDRVYAEQSPADKLHVVRTIREDRDLRAVIMVGDGVNDAPALAVADVGIAMGAADATVSADTADAVITVDRIGRVAEAVAIGRRSLRIATQSVVAGMVLSAVAMGFAAAGAITPVAGALLQEGIDLAVVLNALRALRD
jgi:heavy metal translocating P-type ATPase